MTEAKVERIINSLAELSEEEETLILQKIATRRENRRIEKECKAKDDFRLAWEKLDELGIDIRISDDLFCDDKLSFDDLYFD